jgi:hypothetical protein
MNMAPGGERSAFSMVSLMYTMSGEALINDHHGHDPWRRERDSLILAGSISLLHTISAL